MLWNMNFSVYICWSAHWLFIWHYLQVACLFKMTFMFHDEGVLAQMKHRRKLLTYLQVAVLITIAAIILL